MEGNAVSCPKCGCHHCPVTNTRSKDIRWQGRLVRSVRRYRVCMHCQWPFTTVEGYEDENNLGFPQIKSPDPRVNIRPTYPPGRNPFNPPPEN